MLIAGLLSPALIAFAGAFVAILGGIASDRYWTFWAQWYAANALGSLTFGPIALIALIECRSFSIATLSFRRGVEAASLTMALVAVCAITFEVSADNVTRSSIPALIYSPLPLIIWAAVRFGAKGASAAVLTMTVVLMSLTLNGPSIFTSGDVEPKVFSLQIFLIGLSALVLILGASIDQTRRAETVTRESEARMALAAAAANVGIWHYNLRRNDF
jgi:integral membrane sensor domain MASE1